ncbi:UDP-glycosyltransferase TURAN [Chlorella vulgaris]
MADPHLECASRAGFLPPKQACEALNRQAACPGILHRSQARDSDAQVLKGLPTQLCATERGFALLDSPKFATSRSPRYRMAPTDDPSVTLSVDGATAVVTLNRPAQSNALQPQLLSSLFAQLRKAQSHPDVLCILLAGAGGKFCAGFDFNLFGTPAMHDLPAARQDWLAQMSALLENGAKPTVAAIQGPALGGGCEVAMACNARVCDTGAQLGLPEVRLGILPGLGGTQRTPRLVGMDQALNLMLSGQPISADDALAIGLVDEVVLEQELLAKAKRLALDIASGKVPRRRTLQLNSHMQTSGEVFARAVAALAQAKEDLQRRRLTGQGHYVLLLEAAAAGLAHGPAVGLQKEGEAFQAAASSRLHRMLLHLFKLHRSLKKKAPGPVWALGHVYAVLSLLVLVTYVKLLIPYAYASKLCRAFKTGFLQSYKGGAGHEEQAGSAAVAAQPAGNVSQAGASRRSTQALRSSPPTRTRCLKHNVTMPRCWVMVLGDVGRSPRMQYHASSLCKTPGYEVVLIGYSGAALIEELQQPLADGKLSLAYLPELPSLLRRLPRVLSLLAKALFQLLTLLWMLLFSLPRPDTIMLQLPPALPTMLVCRLAALRHGARLVFDWHNFAHTLMALGMGPGHPVVRLAERYERYWGRAAHASLCVTSAMQAELSRHWRETHALLTKLHPMLAKPLHPHDFVAQLYAGSELAMGQTLCTRQDGANGSMSAAALCSSASRQHVEAAGWAVQQRLGRPALVVTSTSWTPDEDFGLLLKAAELYDGRVRRSRRPALYPPILFLVTGRGPQRQEYERRMAGMDLRHVAFRTLWLEPGDYPLLLGSADLGVVDMFGCGLPVCALTYSCIGELVSHEHNGLLFATPNQLAQQLVSCFRSSNGSSSTIGSPLLARLRRGVEGASMARWHDTWRKIVLPVLEGSSSNGSSNGRAAKKANEAPTTMTGPLATLAEAIQRSQAALSDLDASIVQARCCVSRFDQLRAEAATVLGYDATLAKDFAARAKLRAGCGTAGQPSSKGPPGVPIEALPSQPSNADRTGVNIKQQASEPASTVQRLLLGNIGGLQRQQQQQQQQQHNACLASAQVHGAGNSAVSRSAARQAAAIAAADVEALVPAAVPTAQAASDLLHAAAPATEVSANPLSGAPGSGKARLTPWQALQRQGKAAALDGGNFAPAALSTLVGGTPCQQQQQQQEQEPQQQPLEQKQNQQCEAQPSNQQPQAAPHTDCDIGQVAGSSASDEELMPLATRRRKLLLEKQQQRQQRKRARHHEPPQQSVQAAAAHSPPQPQQQAMNQEQLHQQQQHEHLMQQQQQTQQQEQLQQQQQQHEQQQQVEEKQQQQEEPEVVVILDSSSDVEDEQQSGPPSSRAHSDGTQRQQQQLGGLSMPASACAAGQAGTRGIAGGAAAVVKWYAVVKGRRPGLFTSWNDCAGQVLGFKGGEYKAFPTEHAACQYLQQRGVHLPPKQQQEPESSSGSQGAGPAGDQGTCRGGGGSGSEAGGVGPQHQTPLPDQAREAQQQQRNSAAQHNASATVTGQAAAHVAGLRGGGGTRVTGQKRRGWGKGCGAPPPPPRRNATPSPVDKKEQQAWEAIARAWRQKHMPSQQEINVLKREQAAAAAAMGATNMRTPINYLNAERAAAAAAGAAAAGAGGMGVPPAAAGLAQEAGSAASATAGAAHAAGDRRSWHRHTCQRQVLRAFKVPCEAGRLKDAYRVAVRMYHPDSNSKDKAWRTDDEKIHAEEVMKLINERKPQDL